MRVASGKKTGKKGQRVSSTPGTGTLTIIGRGPGPQAGEKFLSSEIIKLSDYLYERKVKTSTVRENVKKFLLEVGDVVGDAPQLFGDYELHEIEISAELTLSGEVKLWGIGGADVEGKAGLKFVIRHHGKGGPTRGELKRGPG
jgi:hypothetical protein